MIDKFLTGDESQIVQESLRLEEMPSGDLVVDVGGAMCLMPRANYVVDRIPFESRWMTSARNHYRPRVTPDKWIVADACKPMAYFSDKAFDYSICSQTVEDVRDPIGLVAELSRISKSGFISTVHWTQETQSFEGDWAGYSHHRWLVNVRDGVLEFIDKPIYLKPRFWGSHNPLLHLWWSSEVAAIEVFYEGRPDSQEFIHFVEDRWGLD